MDSTGESPRETASSVYDLDSSDPRQELVDRSGMTPEDVAQINALMRALGGLRRAELVLSEASQRYMKLNQTDMRAVHYLIACGNRGEVATAGALARHLGISTASTTKLVDRLERGDHVTRSPHPTDRRSQAIEITADTRAAAMETVGRQQSRRVLAAARLTPAERDVVIAFLQDMTRELAQPEEGPAD